LEASTEVFSEFMFHAFGQAGCLRYDCRIPDIFRFLATGRASAASWLLPTLGNIAEAVVFLLQSDSKTGQTLFVDGGQHFFGNGV